MCKTEAGYSVFEMEFNSRPNYWLMLHEVTIIWTLHCHKHEKSQYCNHAESHIGCMICKKHTTKFTLLYDLLEDYDIFSCYFMINRNKFVILWILLFAEYPQSKNFWTSFSVNFISTPHILQQSHPSFYMYSWQGLL